MKKQIFIIFITVICIIKLAMANETVNLQKIHYKTVQENHDEYIYDEYSKIILSDIEANWDSGSFEKMRIAVEKIIDSYPSGLPLAEIKTENILLKWIDELDIDSENGIETTEERLLLLIANRMRDLPRTNMYISAMPVFIKLLGQRNNLVRQEAAESFTFYTGGDFYNKKGALFELSIYDEYAERSDPVLKAGVLKALRLILTPYTKKLDNSVWLLKDAMDIIQKAVNLEKDIIRKNMASYKKLYQKEMKKFIPIKKKDNSIYDMLTFDKFLQQLSAVDLSKHLKSVQDVSCIMGISLPYSIEFFFNRILGNANNSYNVSLIARLILDYGTEALDILTKYYDGNFKDANLEQMKLFKPLFEEALGMALQEEPEDVFAMIREHPVLKKISLLKLFVTQAKSVPIETIKWQEDHVDLERTFFLRNLQKQAYEYIISGNAEKVKTGFEAMPLFCPKGEEFAKAVLKDMKRLITEFNSTFNSQVTDVLLRCARYEPEKVLNFLSDEISNTSAFFDIAEKFIIHPEFAPLTFLILSPDEFRDVYLKKLSIKKIKALLNPRKYSEDGADLWNRCKIRRENLKTAVHELSGIAKDFLYEINLSPSTKNEFHWMFKEELFHMIGVFDSTLINENFYCNKIANEKASLDIKDKIFTLLADSMQIDDEFIMEGASKGLMEYSDINNAEWTEFLENQMKSYSSKAKGYILSAMEDVKPVNAMPFMERIMPDILKKNINTADYQIDYEKRGLIKGLTGLCRQEQFPATKNSPGKSCIKTARLSENSNTCMALKSLYDSNDSFHKFIFLDSDLFDFEILTQILEAPYNKSGNVEAAQIIGLSGAKRRDAFLKWWKKKKSNISKDTPIALQQLAWVTISFTSADSGKNFSKGHSLFAELIKYGKFFDHLDIVCKLYVSAIPFNMKPEITREILRDWQKIYLNLGNEMKKNIMRMILDLTVADNSEDVDFFAGRILAQDSNIIEELTLERVDPVIKNTILKSLLENSHRPTFEKLVESIVGQTDENFSLQMIDLLWEIARIDQSWATAYLIRIEKCSFLESARKYANTVLKRLGVVQIYVSCEIFGVRKLACALKAVASHSSP